MSCFSSRVSGPPQLPFYKYSAFVTIFRISTYGTLRSADSKELMEQLSPLEATLTKNPGRRGAYCLPGFFIPNLADFRQNTPFNLGEL
jgi:hypothetical protein